MRISDWSSDVCSSDLRIATRLGLDGEAAEWREHARSMHARICERAWSEKLGGFAATFGGDDLDASLLLIHELGFVAADDPRFAGTVAAIERGLKRGSHVFRYDLPDDFGTPRSEEHTSELQSLMRIPYAV